MPLIDVAVVYDDGRVEIVNGGRPAALIAFADTFGHDEPRNYAEVAWLVYRAARIDVPFEEWQETLEELDPREEAVQRARVAVRDHVRFADVPAPPAVDPLDEARLLTFAGILAREWAVRVSDDELVADTRRAIVELDVVAEADEQLELDDDEAVADPTMAAVGGAG